jgi:hypothetical protein
MPEANGDPKRLLIGGKWVDAAAGRTFPSINPVRPRGRRTPLVSTGRPDESRTVTSPINPRPAVQVEVPVISQPAHVTPGEQRQDHQSGPLGVSVVL